MFCLAGESLLVTTGLVIYFGDMMAYTASKVGFTIFSSPNAWSQDDQSVISFWLIKVCIKQISYLASTKALFIQNGIVRSEINTIIQVLFSENLNSNSDFNLCPVKLVKWLLSFILFISNSLLTLCREWFLASFCFLYSINIFSECWKTGSARKATQS